MKYVCLLSLFICSALYCQAQAPKVTKKITAARTQTPPKLDGLPDEEIWQQAPVASDFIQNVPNLGAPSKQRTEVRMLYDDAAVYVSAMLFDTAPDSILTQLSARDGGQVNADMFGVYFDTYLDKQNAFGFEVATSGVQTDFKLTSNGDDRAWDAVWQSAVARHDKGWSVEIRIPYSAIRFPNKEVQTWGINFWRGIRRYREDAFWNFVDSSVQGFVNQFGQVEGISNIKSPLRLSLMPYISGYATHNEAGKDKVEMSVNGGMDVKYGINDAFTLDMTLVPDFGQTQSDAQVLNLSPFEVRFNENRQFFTEGTELFNKAGLFYSRRIGTTPIEYFSLPYDKQRYGETISVIENPDKASLVNATKVSGRTNKGLGIGVFNAVTKNTYATLRSEEIGEEFEVLTDPVTNYNVLVLDQSLPNSSYITFTNTNVTRGHGYYNANVSGVLAKFSNKKNSYTGGGQFNLSQKYFKNTEPSQEKVDLGYTYNAWFGKTSGNFQFTAEHSVKNHTYDINDLGYLSNNNSIDNKANVRYNIYKPFWKLNNLYNAVGIQHRMLYKPAAFSQIVYFIETNATTKNFLAFGYTLAFLPHNNYDYFEPRSYENGVPNRKWRQPGGAEYSGYISSDYRKRFALDVNGGIFISGEYDQKTYWVNVSPRVRVSDHLMLVYRTGYNENLNSFGFVKNLTSGNGQKDIVFGRRTVKTIENSLTGSYIFNARTALNINARHYYSNASYHEYFLLQEDGNMSAYTNMAESPSSANRNFNAFNIDVVYSWRFAPGSEMSIVWKNAIYDDLVPTHTNYFRNFNNTLHANQLNSFSVKLLYYLDYLVIKQALKK
ncbi:hypothetical protein GU926_08840 [Nibribacter ruber]|uniref:Uncharacterized protein n=1 Tax=Nibribacter ruber TaxID=2698458 RepID=A0A6P1NUY0_9BACT|nr:DUF5916 domain-containing protein [Nibribacter ruber]QHL87537.1 hypothetical protein GU926_08840 [Nibribacter ruber]